ncbi:MAG: hypothetical protein PVH62_00090 [Anaerolineae bacterium]|jgi:hypothetical protein
MLRLLIGVFVVLHGLVHLWYVVLSQRLIEFQPEMGWTGRSWIFSPLLGDAAARLVASVLYVLATIGFVAGGLGLLIRQEWWRSVVVGSAALSTAIVILFWDGSVNLVVQKGLIGLLINVAILVVVLVLKWPPSTF